MYKHINHNEESSLLAGKFEKCKWKANDVFILYFFTFLGILLSAILNRLFQLHRINYHMIFFSPQIFMVIGILLFCKSKRDYIDFGSLGLSFSLSKQAKKFLFFYAALAVLIVSILLFLKFQGIPLKPFVKSEMGYSHKLARAFSENDTSTILFYLVPQTISAFILAPIIEEIFFTGIIYTAFRNKLGPLLALLCVGFMFSFAHVDSNTFFFTGRLPGLIYFLRFFFLMFSEILSFLVYQLTRSLYPSIVYHLVRNIVVMIFEISSYLG